MSTPLLLIVRSLPEGYRASARLVEGLLEALHESIQIPQHQQGPGGVLEGAGFQVLHRRCEGLRALSSANEPPRGKVDYIARNVANVGAALEGKDVLMFSYGSGAVATAFTIRARAPSGANALHGGEPFTAARIGAVADVAARLAARDTLGVADFNAAMDLRAERYGTAGWTPSGPLDALFPGTYYLAEVDALHRRTYART